MFAVPAVQPLTAEQFIRLPVPDRGRPWNLIAGEVVVNQPTPLHAMIQSRLLAALAVWIAAGSDRGEMRVPLDIKIDENSVYAPDLLWYSAGRAPGRGAEPPSPMPDIAAEVRSPSTWRYDIGAKKSGYERGGLPELWLLDSAADEILVFRRSRPTAESFDIALELTTDEVLTSPLLPGFQLGVRSLFS